jgi:hypothetical protein
MSLEVSGTSVAAFRGTWNRWERGRLSAVGTTARKPWETERPDVMFLSQRGN